MYNTSAYFGTEPICKLQPEKVCRIAAGWINKKVEETQKVGFFHPFRDCFVSYQKVDKKSFFYPSNIEFASIC